MKSNYDKYPIHNVKNFTSPCLIGWESILKELKNKKEKNPIKVVIECYQGIDEDEFYDNVSKLTGFEVIVASDAYKSADEIQKMVFPDVTNDRIFGKLTNLNIDDFFDLNKLSSLIDKIHSSNHPQIIIGTGASTICKDWDVLIYADMARWEIQQRMRAKKVNNLGIQNKDDEFSLLYKQAFFVDWRICDRIKLELLPKIDYLLDSNISGTPKLIAGNDLRNALQEISNQPFRLVPFFDPGPWGGQWMKEVCDLDRSAPNYAWCFDCVPEENSLLLGVGDATVEIPSLNLLLQEGSSVLGQELHDIMGPEFPIRFDFLDTMDGGNLSLQVHPSVAYIREQFGISYTQDESYYILDAKEDAEVYLGLKEDVEPEKMIAELKEAQEGDIIFNASKHVETWKVKKHDHVLIPAGTIHCSGKNSMVLEISATPYIFTFKLWDWGRLGLDGKPRPINIAHGEKVIQWDRTTQWTKENLINKVEKLSQGDGWQEEKTGLHELEFIETRRHWFNKEVSHHTNGLVNVINLVEGREVIVESPSQSFDPFIVHYAETFVVPASVGEYTIRPYGESEGSTCGTLKAFVRLEALRRLGDDLRMVDARKFY